MGIKIDWKQRKTQLLLLLLVGILLVVIAMPTGIKESDILTEELEQQQDDTEASYVRSQERKLENLLKEVEGAGRVKVMLTFQGSSESVLEKDEESSSQRLSESDQQGGTRETEEKTNSKTTVYQSRTGGEQIPYVTQKINPKVEGVVVIAEGGGNPVVVKNITEAVQALFGVETHKIKVVKRNQMNQEE